MRVLALFALLLVALPARAELLVGDERGFQVRHSAETAVAPAGAFRALTAVGDWWNPDHSWGGNAANLYLDIRPGGCFCEKLPDGGFAEHLRLLFAAPGKKLVFDGALGPLLGMPVNGRMSWTVEPAGDGSRITFVYHVTGHPSAGLVDIAPAVDFVIGEQLGRLASLLDK